MIGNRRMTWRISMWKQRYGEHLCLSHFKLQFILCKIIHNIYDLSRINLSSLRSNCFGKLKSWSKIRLRSHICPRLIGTSLCGRQSSLLCDWAVHISNSKTYVFADSVLCLGGISIAPVRAWNDINTWYLETRYLKDLDRIDRADGVRVDKFPRIHYIGNSRWDDGGLEVWTWAIWRKDHLHVHVQWHCVVRMRKTKVYCEFCQI